MDVLNDLHADFAQAVREAEAAVGKLKSTWQQLLEHLGANAEPVVAQAEQEAAGIVAAAAGGVESAVAQTVAPSNLTTTTPAAAPTTEPTPATTADVTTPPTAQ